MSRVGKQPIEILKGVEVKIEGQTIAVKGPKGELLRDFHSEVQVEQKENELIVSSNDSALWGTTRSNIANMVHGVVEGYEKKLELEGIGYRAAIEGDTVVLNVGFSHTVQIKIPEGLSCTVDKNTVVVSGINKEKVGELAAKIRKVKPAEPYKGKGFRYEGEVVRRKLGKRAVGAGE
ncbi:50S ribosomal protein L6 [Patescibacteria group bacterium]|nr:50S ribosomal protein L6 [Patescibacteria group bacterium]